MMGGLISNIYVQLMYSCRVCPLDILLFSSSRTVKYNRYACMLQISSLEETTIFTVIYFLLQMSIPERILLALILVTELTVAGK